MFTGKKLQNLGVVMAGEVCVGCYGHTHTHLFILFLSKVTPPTVARWPCTMEIHVMDTCTQTQTARKSKFESKWAKCTNYRGNKKSLPSPDIKDMLIHHKVQHSAMYVIHLFIVKVE